MRYLLIYKKEDGKKSTWLVDDENIYREQLEKATNNGYTITANKVMEWNM